MSPNISLIGYPHLTNMYLSWIPDIY